MYSMHLPSSPGSQHIDTIDEKVWRGGMWVGAMNHMHARAEAAIHLPLLPCYCSFIAHGTAAGVQTKTRIPVKSHTGACGRRLKQLRRKSCHKVSVARDSVHSSHGLVRKHVL
jgi:hypothetical protein